MVKIKVIAFFLSLLITMQMLPVEQIGRMLGSNQWTEELPHNVDEDGKANAGKLFYNPYVPPVTYHTCTIDISNAKALAYIHFSEQIPSNHSTEVVVPPPDFI